MEGIVRNFSLFITAFCLVTALTLIWYAPELRAAINAIQGQSSMIIGQ
jgi:hypothetical protein